MGASENRYRSVGFGVLLGVLALVGAALVWPFIPAILWAVVLTILAEPIYVRLRKRLAANWSALGATVFTLAVIGVPLIVVGIVLYLQLATFVRELASGAPAGTNGLSLDYLAQRLDEALESVIRAVAPQFKVSEYIREHKEELTRSLTAPAGTVARHLFLTILTLIIAFLTMFFMLRDSDRLKKPVLELSPLPADRTEALLARQVSTVRGVFVGVVLVALAQGLLATIAYGATGVPNALMWGILTTVLCMIPLIGAPVIYIPLAAVMIAEGRAGAGLLLLALGFGVVSQIDNVIKPFVIGARLELHPMAVFFSLFGGVVLLGPIGLFAGPMALAASLSVVDYLRERSADAAA